MIFYFPMIMPLIALSLSVGNVDNIKGCALGILIGGFFILTNWKHNKLYISDKNYVTLSVISKEDFSFKMFTMFYCIVSEELFFRYFLIGYLENFIGLYSVVVSALLFVHGHFINRWAKKNFTMKSYVYHLLTGVFLGLIFLFTKSVIGCVIAHTIFNSPEIVVFMKRFLLNYRKCDDFFGDYD